MTRTVLTAANVLSPAADAADVTGFALDQGSGVVIDGGTIVDVLPPGGPAPQGERIVELPGRLVLPGFIDSHVHLLWLGEALGKVELTDARDLGEIQRRLRKARAALGDEGGVVLGRGWLFDAVEGEPTAAMLDEAVPDVPVFLDANDLHSVWVNSAALRAMGITADTPDPLGGRISRDATGAPAGMLYERAGLELAGAHLASLASDDDRDAAIERALAAYSAAGVTSVVDMAMDELAWAALSRCAERRGGRLPVRVAAHWLVADSGDPEQNLAQVARAAEFARDGSPWLRVIGIKLILDGVIDACTATMVRPYADGSNGEPLWPSAALPPVVFAADDARLRIAMHAIGDGASELALDVLEELVDTRERWDRRPRIEHLEVVSAETPARMARIGVTASMQPVHADPAIQDNWRVQLGDERADHGFAWPLFPQAGARLAFSTDAPTAPHHALANLHIATTRGSALQPELPPAQPEYAVPLAAALRHVTLDAAASYGEEHRLGRIRAGYDADLVVLDADPFAEPERSLLDLRVVRTVVAGETVFEA
ncbi:amidohydrolase [Herbiconiux sp. SYSU D00978]|uniref:amidohydrolase n=1 Tax=Herbiconiux sp. SYSU D00978 TaxID=2812562 RepID=UPI001A96A7B3|nr:amidohydrolase [Herbiconiux sp. SYSU D00978]